MERIVIDTNVFVSALRTPDGICREVVRLALIGEVQSVFGDALFAEYRDVISRDHLFGIGFTTRAERLKVFRALVEASEWVEVHFRWRPNLRDEADNHVVELALASQATTIVSGNARDFHEGELQFPWLSVQTARAFLSRRRRL